jgi:chemotaxis methyl-accepting protein methylase
LKVAVLGCSTGAEAYSVASTIRSARPELKLAMHAMDISILAVEVAKKSGVYSLADSQLFQCMTDAGFGQLFDRDRNIVKVKPWIREEINWSVGNAAEPVIDMLGPQDIVVANNFLCHMDDSTAE